MMNRPIIRLTNGCLRFTGMRATNTIIAGTTVDPCGGVAFTKRQRIRHPVSPDFRY